MNAVKIIKIIIILLQLIASGIDTESAILDVSSKYNISSAFLRNFL